jgi:hypothetical protein
MGSARVTWTIQIARYNEGRGLGVPARGLLSMFALKKSFFSQDYAKQTPPIMTLKDRT